MVLQAELILRVTIFFLFPGLISIFFRDGMGPFKMSDSLQISDFDK